MILRPYQLVHRDEHIERGYEFYCPACKGPHRFRTQPVPGLRDDGKPWSKWTFDGNMERPTFSPSLLYSHTPGHWAEPGEPQYEPFKQIWVETGQRIVICHLFVQNGVINYCSDNPHEYNGRQGVEMVDMPERRREQCA